MSDKLSSQQSVEASAQTMPLKTWTTPQMIVVPVTETANNAAGDGDGDSALASFS